MAKVTTWKWFKNYVTKLNCLEELFQENSRNRYFVNLKLISELFYKLNYYLDIVLRENYISNQINIYSLNKRIGIIYNHIQISKEIIKKVKYQPITPEEKRLYNILEDQLKTIKKTIKNYFKMLENLEDTSSTQLNTRKKRNRKEINYKEEELEDDDSVKDDSVKDDSDYDSQNEEDINQEKRDKKYDQKYDNYVCQEEEEYILEIDINNPNHVRFIYV